MAFGEDIWDGDMPVVEHASYPYNQFGQKGKDGKKKPPAFNPDIFNSVTNLLASGMNMAGGIATSVAAGAAPSKPQAAAPTGTKQGVQQPTIVYAPPPQTVQPSPPSNPAAPAKIDPTILAVGGLAVAGILVAVLVGGRRR